MVPIFWATLYAVIVIVVLLFLDSFSVFDSNNWYFGYSQGGTHMATRATGNSRFENAKSPPPKKKFPKIPVR